MEARVGAVTRAFSIVPGGEDDEDIFAADFVRGQVELLGLEFLGHLTAAATADFFGFAGTEISWMVENGLVLVAGLDPAMPEWFRFYNPQEFVVGDQGQALSFDEPLLDIDETNGVPLERGKWIFTTRQLPWPIAEQGLLWPAGWLSTFKLQALANWSHWSNTNGTPFVHANNTKPTPSPKDRDALVDMVKHCGSDGGGASFGPVTLSMLAAEDITDGHLGLIQRADNDNATLIAGGSLAVGQGEGAGSFALGRVHADSLTRNALRSALIVQRTTEQQLFRTMLDLNGIGARTPGLRLRVIPKLDALALTELAKEMTALGVPVSVQQLREMTDMRPPNNDQDATSMNGAEAPPTETETETEMAA
jgi:phage gp29-like protein